MVFKRAEMVWSEHSDFFFKTMICQLETKVFPDDIIFIS